MSWGPASLQAQNYSSHSFANSGTLYERPDLMGPRWKILWPLRSGLEHFIWWLFVLLFFYFPHSVLPLRQSLAPSPILVHLNSGILRKKKSIEKWAGIAGRKWSKNGKEASLLRGIWRKNTSPIFWAIASAAKPQCGALQCSLILRDLRFPLGSRLFSRLKIKILTFLSSVSGKHQGHNPPPPLGGKRTIYRIVLLFLALIETKNSFLSLKVASPADGHKLPSCSLPGLLIFLLLCLRNY